MSRKTCQKITMLVAAFGFAWQVASPPAWAVSLNANAAPTNPASAMWTLDQIYNVLDTRTTNVAKRAGAFTEPNGGPTNGTRTLDDIMVLVTNRAPVPKTGMTQTWWPGDDGTNHIGVAWPTQRFSRVFTSGPGTNQIRDNLTGLIWARNANLAKGSAWDGNGTGIMAWSNAFDFVTNSTGIVNGTNGVDGLGGYGGANDWRLPSCRELFSLTDFRFTSPALCNAAGTNKWSANDPFINVQSAFYWSSTTCKATTYRAMGVGFDEGGLGHSSYKVQESNYVWAVRGGLR